MAGAAGGAGRAGWALGGLLSLAACAMPGGLGLRPLPPADGRLTDLTHDGVTYQVSRSALSTAPGGEVLRVYRAEGVALDYSEGKTAKAVAEAYCRQWNRGLSPRALGLYEAAGDWAFPGGCA